MTPLNVECSLIFLILSERVFHSRGPATANALYTNFVRVLGTSNCFVPADLNRLRPEREDVLVVVSDKYAGLRILYAIGSQ